MTAESLSRAFAQLSTPLVTDAAQQLKIPFRISPPGIRPVAPNQRLSGPALPVRHFGSVDIFLEAMQAAQPGDVLVIDNRGRLDEGWIGDLTALEAENCRLAGIIVWARTVIRRSCGKLICRFLATARALPARNASIPAIPRRCAPRASGISSSNLATWCSPTTTAVLFVPARHVDDVLPVAYEICERERRQAEAIKSGCSLRERLDFALYLDKRPADPSYTFREHLRKIGGAIEE